MLVRELLKLSEAKVSQFEKEIETLQARSGRPGKKSDLSAEELKRLKDLEFLKYSESDPPGGNKKLIPTYGPNLYTDISSGKGIMLLRRDKQLFVEKVSDYYNANDLKSQKSFPNTKSGYLEAAKYFLELAK